MSAQTYDVHVSGISPSTTEQHLLDFFTFCGKIEKIDFHTDTKSAVIHFEKASAAKTALMLNGGTLDGSHLTVSSPTEHPDDEAHHDGPIDQSDKPRAGIAAEYLAKGYKLSDTILQRAIEIDSQKGISSRFLSYIQSLDTTLGQKALGPDQKISTMMGEKLAQAQEQARTIDQQKGISSKAGDYYTRAFSSPWGQKVKAFYTSTSKQVFDIHEEARRIASEHPTQPSQPVSDTGISTGVGSAAPPIDPAVQSSAAPLTAADGGKTTEAPTVV